MKYVNKNRNGEKTMDVIKCTRELGKAIQQDERYLKFVEAKKANDEDMQIGRASCRERV